MRLTVLLALLTIGYFALVPAHVSVEAQGGLIALSDGADRSGSNAVIAAAANGSARYVDVFVTGTGPARCGAAATVSATVGKPIATGGAYHWQAMPIDPRLSTNQHQYSLAAIGCYVPSGTSVNFSWAN